MLWDPNCLDDGAGCIVARLDRHSHAFVYSFFALISFHWTIQAPNPLVQCRICPLVIALTTAGA